MKKLVVFSLIVPLLIVGVLYSCICPPVQAAVSSSPSIQSPHHCCCPDMSMPQTPSAGLEAAHFQNGLELEQTGLVLTQSIEPESGQNGAAISPESSGPPLELSLRKKILRI